MFFIFTNGQASSIGEIQNVMIVYCIFGYSETPKANSIYIPTQQKIVMMSRDANIDEVYGLLDHRYLL